MLNTISVEPLTEEEPKQLQSKRLLLRIFLADMLPVRTAMAWQVVAIVLMAVTAGLLAGAHGAASAALWG